MSNLHNKKGGILVFFLVLVLLLVFFVVISPPNTAKSKNKCGTGPILSSVPKFPIRNMVEYEVGNLPYTFWLLSGDHEDGTVLLQHPDKNVEICKRGEEYPKHTINAGVIVGNQAYFGEDQDLEGGVWVLNLDTQEWSHETRENGLPDNRIYALAASSEDEVFAGTYGGAGQRTGEMEWISRLDLTCPYMSKFVHELQQNPNNPDEWLVGFANAGFAIVRNGECVEVYDANSELFEGTTPSTRAAVYVDEERYYVVGDGFMVYNNGEQVNLITAVPKNTLVDIVVLQNNDKEIVCVTSYTPDSGVYCSDNEGETWSTVWEGDGALSLLPLSNNTMLVGTNEGAFSFSFDELIKN